MERDPRQGFYPVFPPFQNPPLGHSRPFFYQQEGAYSQRSGFHPQQLSFNAPRYSGFKDTYQQPSTQDTHANLLGSGNFGVLRGGTFYEKEAPAATKYDGNYGNFFKNGHGRPSNHYGKASNPKPYTHEQFENFRDFADINTPSAYSQFVVVYVNKNDTHKDAQIKKKPKNIIESLALLDLEKSTEQKLSTSKMKLAKLQPEKKHKYKKTSSKVQLHEPLLALS